MVSYLATLISVCMAVCISSWLPTTTAFTAGLQQQQHQQHQQQQHVRISNLSLYSQAPDSAAQMTEFMAKAHEEKVKAMGRVEEKYRGQISDLEAKVAELEAAGGGAVAASTAIPTSGNSFAFPATNKALSDKVQSYRTFISEYIVKAQDEKATAVKSAEAKLTAKYEAIIEKLQAKE